jgi:hypothetical protein
MDAGERQVNLDTVMREQARLVILKALRGQVDETLNSDLIVHELQRFAIRKDRGWVHDELAWLRERGAVTLIDAGTIRIATLTEKGARHLDREIAIEGVQRPSRPEV